MNYTPETTGGVPALETDLDCQHQDNCHWIYRKCLSEWGVQVYTPPEEELERIMKVIYGVKAGVPREFKPLWLPVVRGLVNRGDYIQGVVLELHRASTGHRPEECRYRSWINGDTGPGGGFHYALEIKGSLLSFLRCGKKPISYRISVFNLGIPSFPRGKAGKMGILRGEPGSFSILQ